MGRRILLVDDNPQYRSAVTRNLTLQEYFVIEAEDSIEGMEKIQTDDPQVIITDLDMRTHDEGLQFILDVKKRYPHLPVIMISAVGTFDEGALARQYGATFVLSKSRIDAEIDTLYQRLNRIYSILDQIDKLNDTVEKLLGAENASQDKIRNQLEMMLRDDYLDAGLKSKVYELIDKLDQSAASSKSWMSDLDETSVLSGVKQELPDIGALDAESKTMLAVAESMQQSGSAATLSVARNVSFSYSFAVENEVKLRIGKKINRLLSEANINQLADQLYDSSLRNLDLFFNQYLIRMVQQFNLELNSDITRQVMERIIKHCGKYKPDGLKALGVIVFAWGRNHSFSNRKGAIEIKNPLGIKGLSDEEVTQLSSLLILLQHLRNPYIHPEFNEHEKTESVRKTALSCLSLVSRIV